MVVYWAKNKDIQFITYALFLARDLAIEFDYRTRAIITRGLYTFYPIFEGQKHLLKEFFS